MTHPIFSLIFFNNLIEVITLIQSDPGAVRVKASSEWSHETPLHTASQLGYIEICRYLLDHGADVNSKDSLGATPLHVSCRNGQAEVTKLLLSRGANVEGIVGNESFGKSGLQIQQFCPFRWENELGKVMKFGTFRTLFSWRNRHLKRVWADSAPPPQ